MAKLRGNPNSDVNPTIIKSGNPDGIGQKFRELRKRFVKAREQRIESDTIEETKKLKETEKKLERRLRIESKRSVQRQKLAEAELRLETVKQKERETKAKLEKFTATGKVKGALVLGVKRFREDIRKRKEFLKTPEGQKRIKEAKQRRKKFFQRIKKGVKAFEKVKL